MRFGNFHIEREHIERISFNLLIFVGILLIFFHFLERYYIDIPNLKVVIGIPANLMEKHNIESRKVVSIHKINERVSEKNPIFVFNFETEDYKELESFLKNSLGIKIFFLGKPPEIDVKKFIKLLDQNEVVLGIVEFDDSTGFLNWVTQNRIRKDLVFRVHRIKDKEYESLNLNLKMALSRWKRAVLERSIDLLYVTPPPEKFGVSYQKYLRLIEKELSGYVVSDLRWIKNARVRFSIYFALIAGLLLFASYSPLFTLIYILTLFSILLKGQSFSVLATYSGIMGPVAVFAVVNRKVEHPIKKMMFYAFFAILVGYIINSMLSTGIFLNQIFFFRGVKLSLMTLPALVMIKEILNPENQIFKTRFNRIDLLVTLIIVAGGFYYILRSGNTSLALTFERQFRDLLERMLFVRPRFKELVGYPFLLLYSFNQQKFFKRYSFLVPVIGSIAIVSTINTFCHIKAPLWLSTLRSIEGVIIGYTLGGIFYYFLGKFSKTKRMDRRTPHP